MKSVLAAIAVMMPLLTGTPAVAQDHSAHQTPPAAQAAAQDAEGAAIAFQEAMDRMHAAMSEVEPSGNADVDFARGMIPHHQAAIDMAKTQLEYGSDPEIRKLSQDIIAAQEREIKQLEDWLAKNAPH